MSRVENAEGKKSFFQNLYPDYIYERVEDIPYSVIRNDDIRLILMDMDNTLIDYKADYTKNLRKWIKEMKSKGVKLYIVSNSFTEKKIRRISKELGLQYYYKAGKPSKKGFKKVLEQFPDIKKEQTLMIGDQIFTDVWGGNRFNIKTLLVKRINKKETILSGCKRPLERLILNHYYKKNESEGKCRI